jgi:RHS repeat-associated protein
MSEADRDRAVDARAPASSAASRAESTFKEPSPDSAAPSVGLPSLSAPKGGGAVRSIGEKFSANAATGTASLSVPIATSPGRGGFDLGLSLSYDSGSGNGPFGVGWQCGTPAITRKTDKGLPRYLDDIESDVFIFSGAEDLVPVQEEQTRGEFRVVRYRPRVEGAFARIERWTRRDTGDIHWRTTTGTNVTSVYGRDREARISDPEDPRRVFSWLLEEARDDRGNVVRYTYKAEDAAGVDRGSASESNRFVDGELRATAQRYLKRIEYGNRAPDDTSRWLFEVVFDYGEHDVAVPTPEEASAWPARRDAFSTYRPGFEVRTYRLCRRVLMFHRFDELGPEPYLVRSTDLEYEHRDHLSALLRITQAGYLRDDRTGTYERATLPPLDLAYVERKVHGDVRSLAPGALDGIPGGVDGAKARWVDLEGEGISGVLLANDRGWYYKANLGQGQLAPPALLRSLPVPAALGAGVQQLTDIDGDGRLELVQYTHPTSGYFTRTAEGDWTSFTAFQALPRINWSDPNLRFLDVDGDGLADVLVTEHEALVWYRSRGKDGFEPPLILAKPKDEERGAAVVFNDGTETIQLADMSGDGLVDIVRIRNGEVCYWPNLGRGQFGRKITMDESPWFAEGNQFDPRRVRLADLDGSGTIDVIYLGRDGVRFYFNESGNRLSAPVALDLPLPHSAASVSVVDLLGNGTACLVWSSPLAADGERPLVYVDVMGGQKPHMLARFTNGMGRETRLAYASSTSFYLKDSAEGQPWLTRLPFPVHLLERLERYDHVAGTRLVTRYRYHHGFYDGVDREYRGFAYVEQWDAETLGVNGGGLFPEVRGEGEGELRLPPVRTRTWFHTGAWLERERLERALARDYYGADTEAPRLIQPQLPARLSIAEEREAARALRGSMLRQEIYAEDGLPESAHPYSVTEHTHAVRLLQRDEVEARGEGHAHAVFFVHAHEDLVLYYERRPDDPRVQHQLTLEVDDFGNVLRSAALAYPRRKPFHPEQERLFATLSDATFLNRADEESWYRIGVPIGSATSELTGLPQGRIFTVEALRGLITEAREIPFEATASGTLERRLLARRRALYYRDNLSGALPLGQVESRALPYETYQQAFTPGLLARTYGDDIDDALMASEGRYLSEDGAWWVSSGTRVFDPAAFYQPVAAIDPFGERFIARYDDVALLVVETGDPLGNNVVAVNDYRVLAPRLVIDANQNRTAAAFDPLGMPVRIAFMGKEGAGEGDTLDDPTFRLAYDLHRYTATGGAQPIFVHTFAREKHGPNNLRWQESYSYQDGSGREMMQKVQAPPGQVPLRGSDGHVQRDDEGASRTRFERDRWIGTGRTIFDNKGNPVKKYEPFFSETFEYETESEIVEWGVTPILRYDPLGRLVRTDLPDGTLRKVIFFAWGQETWDENDTVLESRWYRERGAPEPRGAQPQGDARRRAAWLAARHADTPSRAHLDGLGRAFLTEADNRDPSGLYRTCIERDISGNTLAVVDARGVRTVDGQIFDLMGRALFTRSTDAGWSRILPDVAGKTVRGWTARGHASRYRYDAIQRPTHVFVRAEHGAEVLVARHVYGEAHPEALARNLRTRTFRTYDGAGAATSERFDFQGNLSESSRTLALEHRGTIEWSELADLPSIEALEAVAGARLTGEVFTITTAYDALGRAVSRVTPDGSDTRSYYDEASRLDRVDVALRGSDERTMFIESIAYDARGQRTRIVRGNGTTTSYAYDVATFRLMHLWTTQRSGEKLQDLRYEYDAVGNVAETRDAVSFGNEAVSADVLYAYDALYQLTNAEGREHPGQQPSFSDTESVDLRNPHDLQALRRYREIYTYDAVGNIAKVEHRSSHAGAAGWVRRYQYADDSNRLLRTSGPDDNGASLLERYAYDSHGNMTAMPHLAEMRWDYADRLASVNRGGGGQVHFTYDAGGRRVRKVYEHSGLVEERIYLGDYEIYRKRHMGEEPITLERATLHVMDGRQRAAMIETKTVDEKTPAFTPTTRTRYELDDPRGSAVMEVDDDGLVISYEEYLPFGSTAMRAVRHGTGLSAKRYRYTGKERDDETGLYYHGARYYAAWLGRWTSCDPAGSADSFNRYQYVDNNPIGATDPTGRVAWGWVAALVAVVVVVAVVTVVTWGGGTAPAAAGGTALLGAEAAVGTTAAVAGTEVAVGATAAVVGTEVAVGTTAAVVGTEAAVGTTAAVVGTEAAVGTTAAVVGTEAAVVGAEVSTVATGITAAQVNTVGTAVTSVAAASGTPAGQQLIHEAEQVAETLGPVVENEAQVLVQEVQAIAPRLQAIAPQVESAVDAAPQEASVVSQASQLVYRGGSATASNFTPRPGLDSTGLSTFDNLEAATGPGGKAQIIDLGRLTSLSGVPDAPPPGHVSITPGDAALLEEWSATRGTEVIHRFTQELLDAVVGVAKRPK